MLHGMWMVCYEFHRAHASQHQSLLPYLYGHGLLNMCKYTLQADLEQVVLQNIAATAVGAGTNAPEGLRRGTCVAAALQELRLLVDNLLAVSGGWLADAVLDACGAAE